jgi:hypothetical protein
MNLLVSILSCDFLTSLASVSFLRGIFKLLDTYAVMFIAPAQGWKFHVMSEGYMMCHHTALVARRGSPLLPRINLIIQQLVDAGIVSKWVSDFTPR